MTPGVDPMSVVGDLGWPKGKLAGDSEGPSKVERLLRHFQEHERKEGQTLEEYREIIERVGNPMVKFVLNLIELDETKHHEVANAMLATLEKNLFWRHPPAALDVFRGVGAEKEELLALVQRFVRLERDGIKEYKRLLSEAKDYYEGLFSVLLRALIQDSEKHLMFLEFLRKYIQTARS